MEEISKKDILNIIGENLTTIRHQYYKGFDESEEEIGEMPQKPEDFPKKQPDPTKPTKRSGGKLPTWTRAYETDDNGKPIDHVGWFYFKEGMEGPKPIIFTCEWDELIEKHPDLVPKLQERYGEVKLIEDKCDAYTPYRGKGAPKMVLAKPIPGEEGDDLEVEPQPYIQKYDENGEAVTKYTREKINRDFNQILKGSLSEDSEFTNALKKLSLPNIIINNPKHRNSYSDVDDKTISFQSHNINTYNTQRDFIQSVTANVRERDPEKLSVPEDKSLRRLYNKLYSNWSKTRFTSSTDYGKTPVFQLDRGDFPNEQNFEVMVSSDIKITGSEVENNEQGETVSWKWEVEYLIEYAKKAPTDRVARKMIKDGDVKKEVLVQLDQPKKFDGNTILGDRGKIQDESDTGDNHPLTDINIRQGLEQVLDEFKEEMKSMNPNMSIRRAVSRIEDLGQPQRNLREEEIKDVVKRTINKKRK